LGNNRGNKYSKKSVHCSPTSLTFWNFSIDEFALHDIPNTIAYILDTTCQESLSYIGFSQGTAQAFATLAIHPKLNSQVNVFIALAPAMSPAGLSNGVVDALVKASPQVLYLLFGRRSILSSATMWQSILYPPIFVRMVDIGLSFLFKWKAKNISTSQKLAAYPHLYSFTSTKSVVHWFQIIRNKSFQMYDDDVHPPISLGSSSKYTKVAKYPTRNIKTPIVLVYGGSDSLVDIKVMLKELPPQTVATEIPHYEHLDFLWARDVDSQVFQHVFDALDSFTDAEHSKEEYARYHVVRQESLAESGNVYKRGHEKHESDATENEITAALLNGTETTANQHKAREPRTGMPQTRNAARLRKIRHPNLTDDDYSLSSPDGPNTPTTDKPRGVMSFDGSAGDIEAKPVSSKLKDIGVRRGSRGSNLSLDSMKEGKGIFLGASKIAGGIITKNGVDSQPIRPESPNTEDTATSPQP
jgi:lysosomal acid lipase/cholesteryl ester hydrolase